jgi:outer membrane protein OmpA-like peptidoglycan-associated protein
MGPVINTPAKELTPFLAPDDRTLYFSSNGHRGYGSNDIYLTRRLDDSWTNWSEPENLGPDVNTDDWDAYFTVPASGEYAYYSSQKNSLGKSDIVRIKLPDAAKPLPLFLVSGKTFNAKTKQPIEATIQYESLPDGVAVGSLASSAGTGDYTISLARGRRYGFRAEKDGFFPVSDNLDATKLDKYTEVKKDLYLVPIEVGEVVRINNVFFDFAKSDLRPESFPDLNRLVSFLKTNPNVEIQLLGHTDNVGKDGDNLKLSENRIQSVKAYLVVEGIATSRMSASGRGETTPIATNDTEDGRQQNRRVEFTIVKK